MSTLRQLCDDGAQILVALIEAAPDNVAKVCARQREWWPKLVKACEPFGDHVVAQFSSLSPMDPNEQRSVRNVRALTEEHFLCLCEHATLMYRLRRLLDRLPVSLPGQAPSPEEPTKSPGRPKSAKSWQERGQDWATEMRWRPNRLKAREIAEREEVSLETVERYTRDARQKREKAGLK